MHKFMTFHFGSAISRNETEITSRYLEITLSFNLREEEIEDITWLGREKKFLSVLKNVSGVSAPFELLQNAAQRRFVFIKCYKVKSLSCVV